MEDSKKIVLNNGMVKIGKYWIFNLAELTCYRVNKDLKGKVTSFVKAFEFTKIKTEISSEYITTYSMSNIPIGVVRKASNVVIKHSEGKVTIDGKS